MQSSDRRKNSPSGKEVYLCTKCGWVFPNPHPSARRRRAHKKVCGTIQGNDSKTLINGSETMQKIEEIAVNISGFGRRSNCSNTSEDDVFSDAITDFPDSISVVTDSGTDLHSFLSDCDSHTQDISDELKHDNKDAEIDICDRIEMNPVGEVNGDGYDGRSMVEKLSESIPSLPEFEDGMDDNINKVEEVERNDGSSDSGSLVVANSFSTIEDEVNTHNHTICVHKALDSVDDCLTENVNCNVAQLEKAESPNVEELAIDGHGANVDEHDDSSMAEKLFESIPESDNEMDNKVAIERDSDHVQMKLLQNSEATHELMVVGESDTIPVDKAPDFVDDILKEKVNGNGGQLEKSEDSNVEDLENDSDVEPNTYDQTICVLKALHSMDAQLEKTEALDVEELDSASSVVTNSISSVHDEVSTHAYAILMKNEASNVEELEHDGDEVPGDERFDKIDIGLISDNDDIGDLTQKASGNFNEDQCIKESNGAASASTDLQADSFSQTDSLECNWGSISDAPTATETGPEPSQESLCKPELNIGKSVEKKAEKADEDWTTGKQHMSLKSYLGESSPSEKDNNNNNAPMETINTVMSIKEWDSPARYPSKIKTRKGKVRRPYWAPFICCTSVQTS